VLLGRVYDVAPFEIQIKLFNKTLTRPAVAASMCFSFLSVVLTFAVQLQFV